MASHSENELSSEANWLNYSDNYVSGTAPNGFTILASKSASSLSEKLTYTGKIKPNKTNSLGR